MTLDWPVNCPEEVRFSHRPGDEVYSHPQGAWIIVHGGVVTKFSSTGKRASTSATASKLREGHGRWSKRNLVDQPAARRPYGTSIEDTLRYLDG